MHTKQFKFVKISLLIDFGCIVFYTTNLRVSKAARIVILHNMHSYSFSSQMKIAQFCRLIDFEMEKTRI